ncbi:MAG: hypothetical protein ACK4OO_02985 [bacterium]
MFVFNFEDLVKLVKSLGCKPEEIDFKPWYIYLEIPVPPDDGLPFNLDGKLVIVYIKKQSLLIYPKNGESPYKYHLIHCKTLKAFVTMGKYEKKYVMTDDPGEEYEVEIDEKYSSQFPSEPNLKLKMNVCKNCLYKINYKDYASKDDLERKNIYKNFSLKDYLKRRYLHGASLGGSDREGT